MSGSGNGGGGGGGGSGGGGGGTLRPTRESAVAALGRAVQVEPMNPVFKPPGTSSTLLKLKYAEPLSSVAFKSNLRRYSWG